MSEAAGEAAPPAMPAERRGLRAAFGLSGGSGSPPAGPVAQADALLAFARGAHRALRPGLPPDDAELLAQIALHGRQAADQGLEAIAERLVQRLLPDGDAIAAAGLLAITRGPAGRQIFDHLVTACYRALLGRHPGEAIEDWWAQLGDLFQQQGIEGFLAHFITVVMACEEYTARHPEARPLQGVIAAPAAGPATPDREVFGAIVNACYRALLARPAGEVVEAWWSEFQPMFQRQGVDAFLTHFIALLMASEEFAALVRRTQDIKFRGQLVPPPRGVNGIATHLSLGSDGFAAGLLKRFDRRRWSGPFDWLSATPAMIRAAITDDFETLLDASAYAAIPDEERPDIRFWRCRNLRYEEQFGHPCVLHAADMTEPMGQAYMARCVERFRTSLRGLSSKLILQVTPEGADPGRDFIQTADLLDSHGRNVTFVMVSLLPDHAEGPFPEVEPALRHGPHRLLRMRTLQPLRDAEALDMLDEVVLLRAVLAAPGLGG